jgi:phage I-like protein
LTPDLGQFVPRADYDALASQVSQLLQSQRVERDAVHAVRVDTMIKAALRDGKITPATEQYHRKNAMRRGEKSAQHPDGEPVGLQEFESFIAVAPHIVNATSQTKPLEKGEPLGESDFTPAELKIIKATGVSLAAYAAAKSAMQTRSKEEE